MKHKINIQIILAFLLTSMTFLAQAKSVIAPSGNMLVGHWQASEKQDDSIFKTLPQKEKFLASMLFMVLKEIEFKADGSCNVADKPLKKCWTGSKGLFVFYNPEGSKMGDISINNDKQLSLKLVSSKEISKSLTIVYNRVK